MSPTFGNTSTEPFDISRTVTLFAKEMSKSNRPLPSGIVAVVAAGTVNVLVFVVAPTAVIMPLAVVAVRNGASFGMEHRIVHPVAAAMFGN